MMKKQLLILLFTCSAHGAAPVDQSVTPNPFFQMVIQELQQIKDDVETLKAHDALKDAELTKKDGENVALQAHIVDLRRQLAAAQQQAANAPMWTIPGARAFLESHQYSVQRRKQ